MAEGFDLVFAMIYNFIRAPKDILSQVGELYEISLQMPCTLSHLRADSMEGLWRRTYFAARNCATTLLKKSFRLELRVRRCLRIEIAGVIQLNSNLFWGNEV